MSGKVLVVENFCFKQMSVSRQYQLDTAIKLVAGSRKEMVTSFEECIARANQVLQNRDSPQREGLVILLPILLPHDEHLVSGLAQHLSDLMPFAKLFGIVFLLVGEEHFTSESLLDTFWVEVLDGFYDIAIPSCISVWHNAPAAVETFSLAANLSSLFRELDSLQELALLTATLDRLETDVGHLWKATDKKS